MLAKFSVLNTNYRIVHFQSICSHLNGLSNYMTCIVFLAAGICSSIYSTGTSHGPNFCIFGTT